MARKKYFLSALAASEVLYNRTEHSRGFFICFIIKNLLISPRIRVIFKTNFNFQTNRGDVRVHLYSHKARYFQPITTLVRMLQII